MAKTIEGKRVKFTVEMYWRGKKKTPSVNIIYAGRNYEGIHLEKINTKRFEDACNDLCKQMVKAGELDA